MAKGQQRSNREQKKPKKDKAKTPAGGAGAVSAGWSTIDKIQGKDAAEEVALPGRTARADGPTTLQKRIYPMSAFDTKPAPTGDTKPSGRVA